MLRFGQVLTESRAAAPRMVWFHVAAAALIAAFFFQTLTSSLIKSPSSDEPPHIASGLAYVEKSAFTPNTEHPPLLKEMAAVSLLLNGIHLPDTPTAQEMVHEPVGRDLEWGVGNDVISLGHPRRVMFWARLPLILVSTCLGVLIYLWGRQIAGEAAALGAVFLFALDPTVIAHSEFVTTDTGMAAFTILFFYLLYVFLRQPTTIRLLLCGITLGLMLCAKFSTIFFIPIALALVLAAPWLDGRCTDRRSTARRLARALGWFAAMSIIAALVIMAVYRSPTGLSDYWRGVNRVNANANPAYMAYMAGQLRHRFLGYFALAWVLKEPIATLVVITIGTVAVLRGKFSTLDRLFLFLPPLVLFVAVTFLGSNIGVRYLIPMFPFLYIAGGVALAAMFRNSSKWMKGLATVLCAWLVIAAAGIYPDHLSYFNEAACLLHDPRQIGFDGGTRCGPYWLDDSNTDWGQGLEQLRRWRVAHPDSRAIHLAYFGNFPPGMYGIVDEPLALSNVPDPGLYVVSVKFVYRTALTWLRTISPVDVIGHAFYVYDIRPKP